MPQSVSVPILKGMYGKNGDTRINHPSNLIVTPVDSGLSSSFLAPVPGITWLSDQVGGVCRGGINWNGVLYAVTGNRLVSIAENGTPTFIGNVGNDNKAATFMYSEDRLAVVSNGDLFYWYSNSFFQVTDVNVGAPLGGIWVDGYFMLHDGTYLYTSSLADPTVFPAADYAAAESDPDPVKCLLKIKNEPYAVGRYTTEVFQNRNSTTGFSFDRVYGAQVMKGTLGPATACVFEGTIAMLGSGKNEAPSIFLVSGGQAAKIATREIDLILGEYTEEVLTQCIVETRSDPSHQLLYIHLPDKTLMYDGAATTNVNQPVWSILYNGTKPYPMRFPIWCYNRWNVFHSSSSKLGVLSSDVLTWWGDQVWYTFGTNFVYTGEGPFSISSIDLIGLIGRIALGTTSTITMEYSDDGEVWSREFTINTPTTAQRGKRLQWRRLGKVYQRRILKFKWNSDFPFNPATLVVNLEKLLP